MRLHGLGFLDSKVSIPRQSQVGNCVPFESASEATCHFPYITFGSVQSLAGFRKQAHFLCNAKQGCIDKSILIDLGEKQSAAFSVIIEVIVTMKPV